MSLQWRSITIIRGRDEVKKFQVSAKLVGKKEDYVTFFIHWVNFLSFRDHSSFEHTLFVYACINTPYKLFVNFNHISEKENWSLHIV